MIKYGKPVRHILRVDNSAPICFDLDADPGFVKPDYNNLNGWPCTRCSLVLEKFNP